MRALYELSVWIHILAAAVWIGGMAMFAVVVIPLLRRGDRAQAAAFLHDVGMRFRTVGWICLLLLAITGTFNLRYDEFGLGALTTAAFWRTGFGHALAVKLCLFAAVLVMSGVHDFVVGPRATRAAARDPNSAEARRLRRAASWMGRLNLLCALAIVAMAVVLVRGWP